MIAEYRACPSLCVPFRRQPECYLSAKRWASFRPFGLGARLVAHGFEYGGDDIGMAADLKALPEEVPVPEGFVVEWEQRGVAA